MSLWNDIEDERKQSHADHIAKTILDGIEELENAGGDRAVRRWFWELLQNAKDVARSERGIHIRVKLDNSSGEPTLTFSHDGRAFRPADIVRLIEQNSSKTRNADSDHQTTGRFGTGFLTTHLLSRKVHVEGVIKKEEQAPKRFSLPLNREGHEKKEITRGVEESFEVLRGIEDTLPFKEYDLSAFNTSFRYCLDGEGVAVARKGIEDAHRDLPLTLALNPAIGSVEFAHQGVTYLRDGSRAVAANVDIVYVKRIVDAEDSSLPPERFAFVVASNEKVALAVPVLETEEDLHLVNLHEDTPRLFLDFPLIGTESFPLPVAVNSSFFQPREKRNSIYLTDANTDAVSTNRELFEEAVQLYKNLLTLAAEKKWHDLYVLAGIGTPGNHDWLSKTWFINTVQNPLRETVLRTPIVETAVGAWKSMKSVEGNKDEVYLPEDPDADVRQQLWAFAHAWVPHRLPKMEHIHEWHTRVWSDCPTVDVDRISFTISDQKNLAGLASMLDRSEEETIQWLVDWIQFLKETGNDGYLGRFHAKRNGQETNRGFPILPNQNGIFCPREDLFLDDEVEKELKDIATALGEDVRAELLDQRIPLDLPDYKTKTSEDVAQTIRECVEERLKEVSSSEGTKSAFSRLFVWMNRNPVLAEDLFGDLYTHRMRLQSNEELAEHYEKSERFDKLNALVQQHGMSLDNLPELLHNRGKDANLSGAQSSNGHTPFEGISEAIEGYGVTSSEDFDRLLEKQPDLFDHFPNSSLEAFKHWLRKITARKQEVRHFLEQQATYDTMGWQDDPDYPTIVTGVQKHGHDIYLVVRPSDGDKVIFYHQLEIDALDMPDAELWVSDETGQPQQFTLGKLLKAMGVTPRTGMRIDLD